MKILTQNGKEIIDFKVLESVSVQYKVIYANFPKIDSPIARYVSAERAQEVLFELFRAIKKGKKTFEMPVE